LDKLGQKMGYWPPDIPRQYTLEAYVQAFATLGYEVCDNDYLEDGYEKVAIFVEGNSPEHMARQLSSGRWTSKLGMWEDIEHALQGLRGEKYGEVVKVLKRRRERSEERNMARNPNRRPTHPGKLLREVARRTSRIGWAVSSATGRSCGSTCRRLLICGKPSNQTAASISGLSRFKQPDGAIQSFPPPAPRLNT
jgi:hypothetical protein